MTDVSVTIIDNGPIKITGPVTLLDENDKPIEFDAAEPIWLSAAARNPKRNPSATVRTINAASSTRPVLNTAKLTPAEGQIPRSKYRFTNPGCYWNRCSYIILGLDW